MGHFADTRNHDCRIDTGRVRARVIHLNGSRMYVVLLCTRSAVSYTMADATWREYEDVYMYLQSNTYHEGYSKSDKRALRQKALPFVVDGGILKHKSGDKYCRVVVDPAERDRIVESLHANPVGGSHYGQTATIRKVTNRFWWRSVAADTREFVRGCPACQKANPLNKPPPATLHPVAVGDLFHRWGIDLIGPLIETIRLSAVIRPTSTFVAQTVHHYTVAYRLTESKSTHHSTNSY